MFCNLLFPLQKHFLLMMKVCMRSNRSLHNSRLKYRYTHSQYMNHPLFKISVTYSKCGNELSSSLKIEDNKDFSKLRKNHQLLLLSVMLKDPLPCHQSWKSLSLISWYNDYKQIKYVRSMRKFIEKEINKMSLKTTSNHVFYQIFRSNKLHNHRWSVLFRMHPTTLISKWMQ